MNTYTNRVSRFRIFLDPNHFKNIQKKCTRAYLVRFKTLMSKHSNRQNMYYKILRSTCCSIIVVESNCNIGSMLYV